MKSKCILVTGATGFVGRAMARRLVADGCRVRAALRRAVADLPAGVEVLAVGEVGPNTGWTAAVQDVDAVVHLAARAHVLHETAADPLAAFRKSNSHGTRSLAEAARAAGVRRFVYLSTIGVHGVRTIGGPIDESSPSAPEGPYAQSKLEGEQALREVLAGSGTEWVILRPPLVYGAGARGNFARLVKLVSRGLPLPLGAVHNRRSLVYVGNLVDAIVRSLQHPEAAGQTFLISDGEDVSTPELVRRIARALGRPARLCAVPPALLRLGGALVGRKDEIARLVDDLVLDGSRIRRMLGWAPPYTLDQGLAETAAQLAALRGTNA